MPPVSAVRGSQLVPADCLRNRFHIVASTALALLVVVTVCYNQSQWNEEVNHATYSYLSQSPKQSDSGKPGIEAIFGVPVYDFGSALGVRMPLQHGPHSSPFILLRYIFSETSLSIVVLFVLLSGLFTGVASLFRIDSLKQLVLGQLVCVALLSPIWRYVITLDTFTYAFGYVGTASLVASIVHVAMNGPDTRNSKLQALRLAVGFLGLGLGHVNYLVVSLITVIPALLTVWIRLIIAKASAPGSSKTLFIIGAISILNLGPTAWDLVVEAGVQRDWRRVTFAPFLQIVDDFTFAGVKHSIGQLIAIEWWGIAQLVDTGFAKKFGSVTIPPQSSVLTLTALLCVLLKYSAHQQDQTRARLERLVRFVALAVLIVFGLWFTDLHKFSFGPSDVNALAHPIHVAVIVTLGYALFLANANSLLPRRSSRLLQAFLASILFIAALNSALTLPVELREREKVGVTGWPSSDSQSGLIEGELHALRHELSQKRNYGRRILSITTAFDSRKYYEGEGFGFDTYSDLRDMGVSAVNAYVKTRSVPELVVGQKFSSHTGPDYINISTSSDCGTKTIQFLGLGFLVVDQGIFERCGSRWNSDGLIARIVPIGSRVGSENQMSAILVELNPSGIYAVRGAVQSETCPVLQEPCLGDFDRLPKSVLSLKTAQSGSLNVTLMMSDHVVTHQKFLQIVLPVKYDSALRLASEKFGEIPIQNHRGFVSFGYPSTAGDKDSLSFQFIGDGRSVFRVVSVWLQVAIALVFSARGLLRVRYTSQASKSRSVFNDVSMASQGSP